MILDWDKLKITQAELDSVFEPNIFTSLAIALSKVLLLHHQDEKNSLFWSEITLLAIGILFCFPLNLMLLRKLNLIANNSSGFIIVLLSTIMLAGFLMIAINYYLWQQAKKLKLLSKLLVKVIQYNQAIDNFQLLSNLASFSSQGENSASDANFVELQKTLELTKSSLLNSIELEKFIYQQKIRHNKLTNFTVDRYQLLANLESNLIDLSLPEIYEDKEYQQLTQEAIELGLSVHQEIRKIKNLE